MFLGVQKANQNLSVFDRKIKDLISIGDFEQAHWIAEESYKYSAANYGDNNLETARAINNLAWVTDLLGQHQDAESLYKQALVIKSTLCGNSSAELITTLENLVSLYFQNRKYDQCEQYLLKMIDIVRQHSEPWCFREAVYLTQLAEIYLKNNRAAKAEELYRDCIAFVERTMPFDHPNLGRAFANMGDFYRAKQRFQRAEFYYKRAYATLRKSLSSRHTDCQNVMEKLTDLQVSTNIVTRDSI